MRYVLTGITVLLIAGIMGCGDKTDETELREAENLVQGLSVALIMTDVDEHSGKNAGPEFCAPPLGWEGPFGFELPEGDETLYYKFVWKLPLDSADVTIDSLIFLLMFTPDIWDSLFADSIATEMDAWLIGEVRDDIYFHTIVAIPDTLHVTGIMKWNWTETYYSYAYDVSTIDESAAIDITTSPNINLSAQFRFDAQGAGTTEDNWGKFGNTIFVRFEFFAEPDASGYDGYYTLLSEAWKIRHYFVLKQEDGA